MNKLALSSLAALVAVAGLSAPALAAASSLSSDDGASSSDTFNEDIVLQQLARQGIDASDLSEWNGVIRATVELGDGSSTFQYFELGTLKPVSAYGTTGGNTRVLSDRDVGTVTPVHAPVYESLSYVEAED